MSSPSPAPTDTVSVPIRDLLDLQAIGLGVQSAQKDVRQKVASAQIQPVESTRTLVCPTDISQKEAQEYAKLGLSYETRVDGVLLAVWEDPNTQKKHKFVHNPQAFVNANPPANVTWQKDGMIEQQVNLEGMKSIWHFNRNGANTYAQQLASKQVKLADNTLIQSIASKFGGQMHKAFGIPLTSWSRPDGFLSRGDVGHYAVLWLDGLYLVVDRDDAGVFDDNEHYGFGVFLQDTTSDT